MHILADGNGLTNAYFSCNQLKAKLSQKYEQLKENELYKYAWRQTFKHYT